MAKKKAKKKGRTVRKAKKTKPMKTWTHIIKLAESGLTALEAGNLKEASVCLEAVRGIAVTVGEEGK